MSAVESRAVSSDVAAPPIDQAAGAWRGVAFMVAAITVFGVQDGLSKLLAETYAPVFIVMIRYWAFMAFVLALSAARRGGVAAAARSRRPLLQIGRSVLLVAQITLMTFAFAELGLAASHALMAVNPLMIVALGALALGERVDVARWVAVGFGFIGVLVILRPGVEIVDPSALLPLLGAAMFALFSILTRIAGRYDPASVSFFYTGVAGAAAVTCVGPFYAEPMAAADLLPMAALCVTGALGHYLLIRAYAAAEASRLQPYAYLQLVVATCVGLVFFGETLDVWMAAGAGVIVASGLFSLYREAAARRGQGAARRGR